MIKLVIEGMVVVASSVAIDVLINVVVLKGEMSMPLNSQLDARMFRLRSLCNGKRRDRDICNRKQISAPLFCIIGPVFQG